MFSKNGTALTATLALMWTVSAAAQSNDSPVDETALDQLRVVEDPDGFTNVRAAASLDAKVVGKTLSGGVVAGEPAEDSKWFRLFREDGSAGFMHASRLKPVKDWNQVAPAGGVKGTIIYRGFEARVSAAPFSAAEHKLSRDKNGVQLVDGVAPWGQDGGLPVQSLTLTVRVNGKALVLPKEVTANLYEPNLAAMVLLTPGDPAERSLLVMLNSDGAGTYCVAWAFEKGAYRGRAVFSPF